MEGTTIKVSKEVRKRLNHLKIDWEKRSPNETIKELLDNESRKNHSL